VGEQELTFEVGLGTFLRLSSSLSNPTADRLFAEARQHPFF
jgi:hypothetical protein